MIKIEKNSATTDRVILLFDSHLMALLSNITDFLLPCNALITMEKTVTMVKSPITGNDAKEVMSIPVERVVHEYKRDFDLDVARHFEGLDHVRLYQCPDTGYRFFHPFSMTGDERLYDELQQFPWYYLDWKWEYDKAPDYIQKGSKVLEVGSGEGKYLKYLTEKHDCKCTGVELNLQAVNKGKANGLDLRHELVQEHAKNHAGEYDAVYFFQVLEHIDEVKSFLEASVACLKPGGKLLIAVPNNEPFLFKYIKNYTLNVPPHHMGWWDTKSLTAIAPYFGLDVDKVFFEPIKPYYIPGFVNIYIREYSYKNELKRQFMRLMKPYYWLRFLLTKSSIPGQHIMAVYTKK